ncbi:unnamed protein product [Spirodela intermedia]|uniref:PNPLA domain-containing protein n=1 Tax=Spirodela intermedia TaxID=51605 RepID=A0A7I8I9K3_SPIIN|nr:unnamed protein product [Spirodela intermedia]CAA6654103.1 unnamed protein product [Spirodela intermedia]
MAEPPALLRSSSMSRTVAMQVLLCGSVAQLRRRLRRFLWSLRRTVLQVVSLLRPKGTTGMLTMAALIALVFRRGPGVRWIARSQYRRRFWLDMMRCALTHGLYDEELIKSKLLELQHRRREGSLKDMVFFMRTDLLRNLGNMCNPRLHNGRLQVPKLINDYIEEVSTQLKMICESRSGELDLEERLAFVHETRHAFGRTALLLSGGATLAAFHLGVVKVLVDNKLLRGSRSEIESFFENSLQTIRFFDRMGGVLAVMRRVVRQGAIHEIRQLQRLMMDVTRNMTFQEAFDRTGRVLGVTVCSPRKNEPPRCLNYLTSPTSSYGARSRLLCLPRFGNVVPYHAPFSGSSDKVAAAPSARRWRDGTLESDLPMMQLKELFNVNHFIVSQANPHIAPWLRVKEIVRAYAGDFSGKLANIFEMEVKHRFSQLLELGFPLRGFAKLFTQDWRETSPSSCRPPLRRCLTMYSFASHQYSKLIVNPSFMDLKMALNQGSRCTWEKLSAIKATCAVEFALDESAVLLNHMHRLKSTSERSMAVAVGVAAASAGTPTGRPSIHRRIPSWHYVSKQKNPNFLEEDLLADSGRKPSPPSPKVCNSPLGDGEADEAEAPTSWTIRGGQLRKMASSRRLANFVQSLDIAAVKASQKSTIEAEMREQENRVPHTPNSIVIADGDLLQPEKVQNGFVLNVVKKEDYVLTPKTGNPEEYHVQYSEAAIDSSSSSCSGSDSGDDDDDITKTAVGHRYDGRAAFARTPTGGETTLY